MSNKLTFESPMPASQQDLYDYHASGAALERLTPSWERVVIEHWQGGEQTAHLSTAEQYGDLSVGTEVHLRLKVGPLQQRWISHHSEHHAPEGFVDHQHSGPFRYFEHHHRFQDAGPERSVLSDELSYELPLRPLSNLAKGWVEGKLRRMFEYRHLRTALDLKRAQLHPDRQRILISGASGMVGSALSSFLRSAGHEVYHLVRRTPQSSLEIKWDISAGVLDHSQLEAFDAVVHLAGEGIAGRWTAAKKERILSSRVQGTSLLASALAKCARPPKVLISASAIGAYGDCGEREVTEETVLAEDYLGSVCAAWEAAAEPAKQAGVRVVHPRIGVVLSRSGGALGEMLLPFNLGLGGPIGSGRQWMSWIALEDLIGLLCAAIFSPDSEGVFNAVAPNPVRNRAFAWALGRELNRPAIAPLPAFVVKLLFGEMGETLLLSGAKVRSEHPLVVDYDWLCPELHSALFFELRGQLYEGQPAST